MDIKMLTRENIPCWYELSWRPGIIPAIVLRIHRDFIRQTQPIDPEKSPIVAHFIREFKFHKFNADLNGSFGFEKSLQRLGEREGFSEFLIPLPVIKKQTEEKCRSCGGSGKNEYIEHSDCLYCEGGGWESIIEWDSAFAVSASLTVLTTLMQFPEHETSAQFPQLLVVYTITQQGPHGGSLGGEYSIPLVRWLASLFPTAIPEMVDAMKIAYGWMFGERHLRTQEFYFRASVDGEKGWLNVQCQSGGCGLCPSYHGIEKGRGYEFDSHNVDSPLQQLTLLAGLAALHDRARREIKIG